MSTRVRDQWEAGNRDIVYGADKIGTRLELPDASPLKQLAHDNGEIQLRSEVQRCAAIDNASGHARAGIDEVARDVNFLRKDRKLERGPAHVVAAIEVGSLLRDGLAHSSAVAEDDRVE